jgi:transcriptional regulator with XRE-family HTH domain
MHHRCMQRNRPIRELHAVAVAFQVPALPHSRSDHQPNLTLEAAARQLDMSKSNLSRIENGQIKINPRDVRAALALYHVTGDDAEKLIEIARGAQQRGWWQSYSDVLPDWFEFYLGLEAEASSISTFEGEAVPGLLQTDAYARAITQLTVGDDEAERKVAARMRRQEALHRPDAVLVSAVINEAVLMRQVGGADTMAQQLIYLTEISRLPNVTIRVLPFAAGGHPSMTTNYVILTFPDAADDPVVYLDNLAVGLALEEAEHVRFFRRVHDRLLDAALTPQLSIRRIEAAANDLQ